MANHDEGEFDERTSETVEQIRTQMSLEGKLDRAYANQGAVYLFGPIVLLAVFGILTLLAAIGLEGEAAVVIGAGIMFVAIVAGIVIFSRK